MGIFKRKIKRKKNRKGKMAVFSYGNLDPDRGRILILVVAIIFSSSILIMQHTVSDKGSSAYETGQVKGVAKESGMQKEIKEMVAGYPIEKMTPYILQKDPKVAAFLVAIAKKESAWGEHAPVLNGQDCYNYWGFRLTSERMGSGGHTCFDSPQEAVDTVASRIDEMVNDEKLDSPKEMVVWKCGYGCQDKPKTPDEKKWIKDVSMYYKTLTN